MLKKEKPINISVFVLL